ncbi:MAG: septum formation protein Maf [Muribaculaceae bacterium]|nr:septum formation protein Maf [Muribaculaceae bacterium]
MLNNLDKYDVVLGSNSPRRRELLNDMGVTFRVEAIKGIDESYPANLPVEEIPVYLSRVKAQGHPLQPHELLITADTVVVLDDTVLGKPQGEDDARRMLRALSGRAHRVISGVCVTTVERSESFADTSIVRFAELTSEEIDYYIEHYHPLDKAGAYGIQEWIGNIGILGINGDFYNVMGLPTRKLYQVLKTF